MLREKALEILLDKMGGDPIVCTTGETSREVYEIRARREQKHRDFFVLGSMGAVGSIGLGIALNCEKRVYLLDGDASVLMRMGTLATIGHFKPNLVHVVLDNEMHGSTGGQPTVSPTIDWVGLFQACGYQEALEVGDDLEALSLATLKTPAAVVVNIEGGSRRDLGRPILTPQQIKKNFMALLREKECLSR